MNAVPRAAMMLADMGKYERTSNWMDPVERLRQRLAGAEEGWFFAQIAGQVAERRLALGLSQAALARRCGTTQSAIARLEAGGRPPRIDTLLGIADALGADLVVELRPREAGEETAS